MYSRAVTYSVPSSTPHVEHSASTSKDLQRRTDIQTDRPERSRGQHERELNSTEHALCSDSSKKVI